MDASSTMLSDSHCPEVVEAHPIETDVSIMLNKWEAPPVCTHDREHSFIKGLGDGAALAFS